MRSSAIVLFVIAALSATVAIKNVISGDNRPEGVENIVGYAVGSFLLPIALLVVGLVLWGKSKTD